MAETFSIGPGLLYSAAITFPIVCSGITALRFYARKSRGLKLWWDDWLLLPALITLFMQSACVITGVALHGVGYRATPPDVSKPMKLTRLVLWINYLTQTGLLTFVKISFILWYHRIFSRGSPKWYRYTLFGAVGLLLAWGISFFFAYLFICPGHPQAYWVFQTHATTDVILDIMVILLPILPLYKLQMSDKKRIGVLCVFLLGALTIVVSIVRMVAVWMGTVIVYNKGTDIPFILTRAIYWGLVESGTALLSCCLPTCAVLLKKVKTKPVTPYENRSSRSSIHSAIAFVKPSTYRKEIQDNSISVCSDDTVLSRAGPTDIIVTQTFTTESTPQSPPQSPPAAAEKLWAKHSTT